MDDEIRRLMGQYEEIRRLTAPVEEIRRLTGFLDPFGDSGAALKLAELLKGEDERRRWLSGMPDFAGVPMLANDFQIQERLYAAPVAEAKRLGLLDPATSISRDVAEALQAQREYGALFRLPVDQELERIARETAPQTALTRTVFADADQLRSAMAAMKSPWLQVSNHTASARAFGDLIGMGRGIAAGKSFDPEFGLALREGLGDWRDSVGEQPEDMTNPQLRVKLYTERGFDSELTNFTPAAFDEGVLIAGLREPESMDDAGNCEEAGFRRAQMAYDRLHRFEVTMRRFISRAMEAEFGAEWMKMQLPNNMLEGWVGKREKAVMAGQQEYDLIEYADFTDYRAIIEKRDNWLRVFRPIFRRVEDVRESFQRLFPVRIATMHSRLLTLDDDILLLVETKRIMKAIADR